MAKSSVYQVTHAKLVYSVVLKLNDIFRYEHRKVLFSQSSALNFVYNRILRGPF